MGITTSGALPISAPPSLVLSLLGVVAGAAALVV